MRSSVKTKVALLLWSAVWLGLTTACWAQGGLESGFRKPPASARPHTWWHWMNGNISREGITADLEAMKRAGIGGAQMFHVDQYIPAGKVPYMSPQWREMIVHAAKEAKRLGLELCIHNCAGWSSSGGPWITPEHAMQTLVWSEKSVHGPVHFSEALPQPKLPAVPYYRDVAILAFKTPEGELGNAGQKLRIADLERKAAYADSGGTLLPDTSPTPPGLSVPKEGVLNLTDKTDATGRLTWDAPEGEWTILRIGHTPTGHTNAPAPPEGRGLECDKLSREALDAHWNGMMAKILADLGPLAGKVLNNALIDSYEVGAQNWTPKFREEFQKRRGYDLLPYLPVLAGRVVDSIVVSERFLWDFRRTIADLYADNYYGYFGELCHKHGLKFSTEPYYSGMFDNLQVGGLPDIPMGEFWINGAAAETTKLASSAAHTNGRQVVGAESFTADWNVGKWLVEPYGIKALGDRIFCNGVNRYIFHRYAHQPWLDLKPGMTMGPWGTHFERTVTWWNQSTAWLRYVARCQYLLQSGRFVADACYYYGEGTPNFLPDRRSLRPELPDGYDYDGCDTTVLLKRMTVQDGRIVLPDGMTYRVLMLPENGFVTPSVLRKIRELVQAGATVVGPKPAQSPSLSGYPACDTEVKQIGDEVWGDVDGKQVTAHAFGKGQVIWGRPLADVLTQLGQKPDFEVLSKGVKLVTIHRAADGAELYFVSNQRYRREDAECAFRVSGKIPELWHPDTGQIEAAPVYRNEGGRTVVPLHFDPAGSVFVVFRRPETPSDHLVSITLTGAEAPKRPQVEIRRAFYGAANGQQGADVTAKVAEMVADGNLSIPASNDAYGDPVPNVVKSLRVEYVLDGKPMQKTAGENETLELAAEPTGGFPAYALASSTSGTVLTPWQPGVYEAKTAQGRTVKIPVSEAGRALEVSGPWTLRFPSGWGAPAQVTLEKLISWPEHSDPGVRYFSGTAEYEKTLEVPAEMLGKGHAVLLDLGQVKNFAEVRLNGHKLGILWKAPFQVDVTGLLKPGHNALSINVTNLWPNRLIGDEQLPAEVEWEGDAPFSHLKAWPQWLLDGTPRPKTGRYTFTTWRFYTKDSPLIESGLIGPVTLRSAQTIGLP